MSDENETFLVAPNKAIYRHWWTMIPALPATRQDRQYHVLKRMWADHTTNTVKPDGQGGYKSNARGVYQHGTEDHITIVLFQNWALFPGAASWAETFLRACDADVSGPVQAIAWSYEFLSPGPPKSTPDIVMEYRDTAGTGVLVIEAKACGLKNLKAKDSPERTRYLAIPEIDHFSRKSACLLVDGSDCERAKSLTGTTRRILTWQRLAGLQTEAVKQLDIPESARSFVIGSLVATYARYGILPDPLPYHWLKHEPTALDINMEHKQPRSKRMEPCWQLSWKPAGLWD